MSGDWLADLPKFDSGAYSDLALNDLVTFAVFTLADRRSEISAEDIVAGCFTMFPDRFSLRGYGHWPDSTVVNKRWLDCRAKGLISGSTQNGFAITAKGLTIAQKASSLLRGGTSSRRVGTRVQSELRTRAGRFVRALEKSDAYRAYVKQGNVHALSEFDFRSMLFCTMESSAETLKNNMAQLRQFSEMYERNELIEFLHRAEQKFSGFLKEAGVTGQVVRGGMLPKHQKR